MKTQKHVVLSFLFASFLANAQDWSGIPVPADPGQGKVWKLQDKHSDDFNYSGKNKEFSAKWNDRYFNAWDGPGLTEFSSNHSDVTDGNLAISASRSKLLEKGFPKVNCGVVTSKTKLKYPVYMEANIKVMNQVLSSNFWLLSQDDTRELDILEIYGGDRRGSEEWFAKRANSNYHIFVRNSSGIQANYNDQKQHLLPNSEPYRNDYHRFGAYWKDPWNIDFYIDGILVRSLTKNGITDPANKGLNREMWLIIDVEDHDWRSFPAPGARMVVATDEELANESKNKMLYDWVRVYKPVSPSLGITDNDLKNITIYPNPANQIIEVKGISVNSDIALYDYAGRKLLEKKAKEITTTLNVSNLNTGLYLLKVEGYIVKEVMIN